MYLRRNEIQGLRGRRAYLTIAHNVWCPERAGGQSRRVVLANLGCEDKLDRELAAELVEAIERNAPGRPQRGEGRAAILRFAADIRRIEPALKRLVSRAFGLADRIQPGPMRVDLLEALVRGHLSQNEAGAGDLEGPLRVALPASTAGN
ncbi:MAG: hypothetical protein KC420_05335 [Myxococcales bacterium]|nr:hypothetical protein [Myxococcales bacterium]MCB9703532.1 hypothetical protein [Myxococcales bacterium]